MGFFHIPLNRNIVRLAVPTILMNISTPLIGAVDTAVVGHLDEVYYLGAVSLGTLLFSILYFTFNFLRMGTIGMASQAKGAEDEQACANVLGRGVVIALLLGLLAIAFKDVITLAAFRFLDASVEVERLAETYFDIRILAAPAALLAMVFQGWFYGMKNVAYPVALTIFVNVINVALDFWFVVGLGYTSDGVAWATVISQYLGLGLTLLLLGARYRFILRLMGWKALLEWAALRRMLSLNRDIFLRTLSMQVAHLVFMALSASMGDLILAANTILLQMRLVSAYALDGFATAAEVTVGQAIGSGNRKELLLAIRLSLVWGVLVGGGISLVYGALAPWWPHWFTNNPAVLAAVYSYILWVVLDPWVGNLPYILDGIFVGATAGRVMRNTVMFSVFVVFLPTLYGLSALFGNHGMWAATVLLLACRGVTLSWPVFRLFRDEGYRLGE